MCWRLFWSSQISISWRSERFEERIPSQVVIVQFLLAPKYWLSCCGLVQESRRKKPAPEWYREASSWIGLKLYLWKVSEKLQKAADCWYAHFGHEILKSSQRKSLMVSVCSTWLVASHRITVAFPWQAFVLPPARKGKHDKVTVVISPGFMRAHRWIWLGWRGNQKSINGWWLFLPQMDFRFWQPLGNVLPGVMSLEMLKTRQE